MSSYAFRTFQMALSALLRWPLRAGLTAFGILIGVAAVTVTVALGEGTRQKVSAQVDGLGSSALQVRARSRAASGAAKEESRTRLTETDAAALRRELGSSGVLVAPLLMSSEQLVAGQQNFAAPIKGTSLEFFELQGWKLASGAWWNASAESTGERVCLIGQTLRGELFGSGDPIGRLIRIARHPFRVIGLLEAKGQGTFGRDQDAVVFVPIKAARSKLRPAKFGLVDSLLVGTTSQRKVKDLKGKVTRVLRQRHGLAEGVENDFRIRAQGRFQKMQEQIVMVLNLLLVSVSLVSLVVGGVGIMNIMLVSVSERTKEIGIRLAVGARQRDIWAQFLVEAVVLSLLGGGLGVLFAFGAVAFLSQALDLPMRVSPGALFGALGVSVGIGVVFGFLPARRAASLDPIQALSRE